MANIATITIDARTFEYMADRIEELEAEIERLRGELEKAQGALSKIQRWVGENVMSGGIARTTLAELKGQRDE